MNFATLKGLTIPEGKVTKITDASGRVMWAINVAEPCTITIYGKRVGSISVENAYVIVGDKTYSCIDVPSDLTGPNYLIATLEVMPNTKIIVGGVGAGTYMGSKGTCTIRKNYEVVVQGEPNVPVVYEDVIMEDTNIELTATVVMVTTSAISIVPANWIRFTLYGIETTALVGMTWREWCDSEFNNSGYYCSGSAVYCYDGTAKVFDIADTNVFVTPDDVIIEGHRYGQKAE